MNPDPANLILIEACITVVILVLCGLLTAAQKAISDVNRNNIKEMAEAGDVKAQRLVRLFEKTANMRSVTYNFLGFAGFLIGEMLVLNHFDIVGNLVASINIPFATQIGMVISAMITSIVFLVLGVFLPRQIARQHAEGVAKALAGYAKFMIIIGKPFVAVTSGITNVLLKITRQKKGSYEEKFSEENVISMLEKGQDSGAIKEEGKKMINSIFDFDDKLSYEIMTPRTDVFAIDIQDNEDEYIEELMEMRYSRIPVYEDDSDNIIGILNIKDYLIQARQKGFDNVDIRSILREPFFVPETKNIDSLFLELQKTKQHIAILIDEYGGFSGIVTLEDIIEEVMGEIDDEFDEEEGKIEEVAPNKYLLEGYMDLDEINEELKINLQSETSETVGGLIIDILGEIPSENATEKIVVAYENYEFEVINVKDRRIEKILMTIKSKAEIEEENKEEAGE